MLFDVTDHFKLTYHAARYIDNLTDEDAGRVFDAIMVYCRTGEIREFHGEALEAFEFLKKCADYQETHPRWRGGLIDDSATIRRSNEYRQWREKVFKRDEYTCAMCGQRGGKLNAHHIKEFAKYPECRLDVSNGITLCEQCHKDVHRRRLHAEPDHQGINQTQSGD